MFSTVEADVMNEEHKIEFFESFVQEVQSEGLSIRERLKESEDLPDLILTPKSIRQATMRETKLSGMSAAEQELERARQKERQRAKQKERREKAKKSEEQRAGVATPGVATSLLTEPSTVPAPGTAVPPGEGGNRRQRREGRGRGGDARAPAPNPSSNLDSPALAFAASQAVGAALARPVSGIEMALHGLGIY